MPADAKGDYVRLGGHLVNIYDGTIGAMPQVYDGLSDTLPQMWENSPTEAKAVLVTAGGIVILPVVYIAGVEGTNVYLTHSYAINQAVLDGVGSYLPGVPAASWWGYGGATVGYFYGPDKLYNDLKDISQSDDSE